MIVFRLLGAWWLWVWLFWTLFAVAVFYSIPGEFA